MKKHVLLPAVFCLVLCPSLPAQAPAAPTPAPAAELLPEFQVLSRSVTKEMAVEPAPLPGMTPVSRERTVTIERVADPHLPAPLPPPPPANPTDPALKARLAAFRAAYQPTRMIGLSATTYDFATTRLRWRSKARPDEPITAWSNLNFEYIRGHSDLKLAGEKYMLFLGYGVETTANLKRRAARFGVPYVPPVLPELPELATAGPAFIITEGDATGTPELEFLATLHAVYPGEEPRLKAAYEAREAARKAHEAYVRAHPPVPHDLIIKHWNTTGQATLPATEGGAQ